MRAALPGGLCRSWRRPLSIEVLVDIGGPEAQPLADADGRKSPVADELVDLTPTDPEVGGGIVHRQERLRD